METNSQTHTRRAVKTTPKRAFAVLALLAVPTLLPGVASGQLRVDTTLYSSSGSCAKCDLSGQRMNGMTLKDANFAGSIFNNSNLSGGKLHGSDLTGAHFRRAMLYGVRGQNVTLHAAVMEDATLTGAELTHSTLSDTDMRRAELARGRFHDNDFRRADLSGAKLSGADLARSDFTDARLDNAALDGATLDGSRLTNVSFGLADMTGATLKDTHLPGSDLHLVAGLTQAQLDGACGDRNTRLPAGLSVSYCEDSDLTARSPAAVRTEMQAATRSLDRALNDVEALMRATRDSNARARLQRIHRDLTQSRAALEN